MAKDYSDKRILVICSREICYFSGNFFMSQMADAFERLGAQVTRASFTVKDDLDAILVPLHHQNFDLILDLNTQMCHLEDDDGMVLDLIGGPFFDYIVDHPLFHYNSLNAPIRNLNAIAIDRGQKAFVDRYYKNVKRTLFMPLAANEALDQTKRSERPDAVLLMSSYVKPEKSHELIEAAPEPLMRLQEAMAEQRIADPSVTNEEALAAALKVEGFGGKTCEEIDDAQFALILNACYPADAYVRNVYRDRTTRALLDEGLAVRAVGEGWENFCHPRAELLTRIKACDFSLSYSHMAKEDLMLNNAPMFPDGMHDRVIGGLANHCAVLTDETPYLNESFAVGKELFTYQNTDLKAMAAQAADLLLNPHKIKDAQAAGYEAYKKAHTWDARARELLDYCFSAMPSK